LREAERTLVGFEQALIAIQSRTQSGQKFGEYEVLSCCMASERGHWMKSVPKHIAEILGYNVLPAAQALTGDGVDKPLLSQRLPSLRHDIDHTVQECERVRLAIKPAIQAEYDAMRAGQSQLLEVTRQAQATVRTAMAWAEDPAYAVAVA
jgi:hypothetical protein